MIFCMGLYGSQTGNKCVDSPTPPLVTGFCEICDFFFVLPSMMLAIGMPVCASSSVYLNQWCIRNKPDLDWCTSVFQSGPHVQVDYMCYSDCIKPTKVLRLTSVTLLFSKKGQQDSETLFVASISVLHNCTPEIPCKTVQSPLLWRLAQLSTSESLKRLTLGLRCVQTVV